MRYPARGATTEHQGDRDAAGLAASFAGLARLGSCHLSTRNTGGARHS